MTDETPKWSLPDEIKKRKTQEISRALDKRFTTDGSRPSQRFTTPLEPPRSEPTRPANRGSQSMQAPPELGPLRSALTTRPAQRVTQTAPQLKPLGQNVARTVPASKRTTQVFEAITGEAPARWTKRQRQTALVAALVIVSICLLTSLIATRLPAAQATLRPLPVTNAENVASYLKAVGLPLMDLREFAGPDGTWGARQIVQFETRRLGDKGTFIILSYDRASQAGPDIFRATSHPVFKAWKLTAISNILVLASPKTPPLLIQEINSHLTRYLIAPYRSFIPTTTPGGIKYSDLLPH